MREHLKVLGWLHLFLGAVDLAMALLLLGVVGGLAFFLGMGAPALLAPLTGTVGVAFGILVALTALPNFAAGVGLLKRKDWGRALALLLAVVNVLKFPWGTALAAYTLWILSGEG